MRIATALDRFLESATEPAPRVTALEFLVRQLETSAPSSHTLRAVFLTLEHAAGEDFGFEAARGLNDPSARLAAIRQAVRSASAWWKRERRRIAAPSEPATPKTPPTPR